MDENEEKEFLEDWREGVRASIEYFCRENESELERDVVKNFLRNMEIPFDDTDVASLDDDPPDVFFGEARFEVKHSIRGQVLGDTSITSIRGPPFIVTRSL